MRIHAKLPPVDGRQRETLPEGGGEVIQDRRSFLRWSAGLLTWAVAARGRGSERPIAASRPSTSRTAREQAIGRIPFANLQEPVRSQIRQIVTAPSVYRRMPVEVIPCDPELYVFLVRYPEVMVNMWQLMGVTKVKMKRTGTYAFDAEDGAGTVSKVTLVYGTREKHLFVAEGYYHGPLAPRKITGRCVLLLTSGYSQDAAHRAYVSNRLDVFVQFDNAGAEIVAKTLHPFLGRTADNNFSETTRFLGQVCRVAENNGQGVQRLAKRLTNIRPAVRDRFSELTMAINQRAVMRAMINSPEGPTVRLSDRPSDMSPDR